jgi:hypothetical protein
LDILHEISPLTTNAARPTARRAVAELVGDRHVDAALIALSRRWGAARPAAAAARRAASRAAALALRCVLLVAAGLAAGSPLVRVANRRGPADTTVHRLDSLLVGARNVRKRPVTG